MADSGYVPQSMDTDEAADRLQFEIWRSWTMQQKLDCILSLCQVARELSLAGLRIRHPEATLEELELREAALRLGPELARAVYKDRYDALVR